jgi:poly(hydroxyalkanoate) depolymerase family esterase
MKSDFATAMGRALDRVRAGDPHAATRMIQAALAGASPATAGGTGETPAPGPRRPAGLIDPEAEAAEIVDDRPGIAAPPAPARPAVGRTALGGWRQRRHLGDTIDGLSRGRPRGLSSRRLPGGAFPAPKTAPPAVREGARYEWRSHGGTAGARDYRLYVPAALADGAQGLVLMLHGCTQNPDDFAIGTRMNDVAERHGLVVAYPAQTRGHNAQGCWNWFRASDQGRSAGEPAIIAGIAHDLMAEFGLDRSGVFAAGLSAGGAMAAILGETYPDLFAGIGVHSGLPAGSASDVVSAFAAMRGDVAHGPRPSGHGARGPRIIVFHGAADATVHPSNGDRIVSTAGAGSAGSDTRAERGMSEGGRTYSRTTVRDARGTPMIEHWVIEGAGHAWSGGSGAGTYTDPAGPDASEEMVRFFLAGRRTSSSA